MRRGRGLRSSGVTIIGQAKSATLRRGLHVVPASCTSVLLLWEPYMRPYGALSAPVRLSSAPVSIIREKRSSKFAIGASSIRARHMRRYHPGEGFVLPFPPPRSMSRRPSASMRGRCRLTWTPSNPLSPPAANAAAMPSPEGTHRRMLDELDPLQRRGQAMGGGDDRGRGFAGGPGASCYRDGGQPLAHPTVQRAGLRERGAAHGAARLRPPEVSTMARI